MTWFTEAEESELLLGIDIGIRHYVQILRQNRIETCQSCEGGPDHSYPEPTVDFLGGAGEGPRAVGVALTYALPIMELRRVWNVFDSALDGPHWSMTFRVKADEWLRRTDEREHFWLESKKTGRKTYSAETVSLQQSATK